MKIPQADYAATVAFYRDTLGWTLEEVDGLGTTAHWVRNPPGVVHLLAGGVTSAG